MFTQPRINVVASDEGFTVYANDRFWMKYVEGDRMLSLELDPSTGEPDSSTGVALSVVSHWDKPHEGIALTQEDRSRIGQRIKDAMAFISCRAEIE